MGSPIVIVPASLNAAGREAESKEERLDNAIWQDTFCHMASKPEPQLREIDIKDNAKMSDLVTHGIELSSIWELGKTLAISNERLAELLSISKRTLHRRSEKNELLKQDESERVVRIFRLLLRAAEVFEDRDRAVKWLSSRPKALGGKTPLEFARTEPGARLVEDVLGRIEEGVFS